MHHPPLPYPGQTLGYGRRGELGFVQSRSASRRQTSDDIATFDSLSFSGDEATVSVADALILASGARLDVYRVEKERLASLGYLDGLRGSVISAKILPSGSLNDPLWQKRPLVALIVHGPLSPSPHQSRPPSSHSSEFDPSASTIHALRTAEGTSRQPHHAPPQAFAPHSTHLYQTTVEVYSLRDRTHVATLYKSASAEFELLPGECTLEPPSPIGGLTIQASGRFVVLTTAESSGEVYIYEAARDLSDQPFKCIGKTWTTVPSHKSRTWSSSSASEPESPSDGPNAQRPQVDAGLVSLSSCWLAIAPPPPSFRTSVSGGVPIVSPVKPPPGFGTHTSGMQPPVTCEAEKPLEESRLNKVARDVTQEMIKGAIWAGDKGVTAWKKYWNKPAEPSPYDQGLSQPPMPQFPPTHASDQMRVADQPTVISVIDLEKLSHSQDAKADVALNPMATFPLTGGCSFISFSPNGLSLLTASAKGDVSTVWDLMRLAHGNQSLTRTNIDAPDSGPLVRQLTNFTRVTVARIRDVVWSEPHGEHLAIVTDRGTVHLHDLPAAALQWPPPPPPRTKTISPTSQGTDAVGAPTQPRSWSAAFNAVSNNAQPLIAAVRSNPLANLGQINLAQAGAGAAAAGNKLMVSGVTRSVGAAAGTVNTIRHMGENRLHLPEPLRGDLRGCVRWLRSGRAGGIRPGPLAVVSGGVLRIHAVKAGAELKGNRRRATAVGTKLAELSLPAAPPTDYPTTVITEADDLEPAPKPSAVPPSSTTAPLLGQWPASPARRGPPAEPPQPLSRAEIDTCAPRPPFHADRRVTMAVYVAEPTVHRGETGDWVFGEEIPVEALDAGRELAATEEEGGPDVENAAFVGAEHDLLGDESGVLGGVAVDADFPDGLTAAELEIHDPELQLQGAPAPLPEPEPEPYFEPWGPPKKKKGKKKKQAQYETEGPGDLGAFAGDAANDEGVDFRADWGWKT